MWHVEGRSASYAPLHMCDAHLDTCVRERPAGYFHRAVLEPVATWGYSARWRSRGEKSNRTSASAGHQLGSCRADQGGSRGGSARPLAEREGEARAELERMQRQSSLRTRSSQRSASRTASRARLPPAGDHRIAVAAPLRAARAPRSVPRPGVRRGAATRAGPSADPDLDGEPPPDPALPGSSACSRAAVPRCRTANRARSVGLDQLRARPLSRDPRGGSSCTSTKTSTRTHRTATARTAAWTSTPTRTAITTSTIGCAGRAGGPTTSPSTGWPDEEGGVTPSEYVELREGRGASRKRVQDGWLVTRPAHDDGTRRCTSPKGATVACCSTARRAARPAT